MVRPLILLAVVGLWFGSARAATLNVTNYGAIGDCREITVTVTSNSAVVIASTNLGAGDVGKVMQLFGAGYYAHLTNNGIFGGNYGGTPTNHQDLVVTILSVSNGTNVTISSPAGATASGLRCTLGTDNRVAFSNCISAAVSNDVIQIPAGNFLLIPPTALDTNYVQASYSSSQPTIILRRGGLRFVGAGTNSTRITGAGAWQQKGYDDAYRGYLFRLTGPVTNNGPLIFDGIHFDGAAERVRSGYTGWPAVPTDGSGWDATHHPFVHNATGVDYSYLGITNCLFTRWHGETIQGISDGTGILDVGNCWFIDGNATVINYNNQHDFHDNFVADYYQVAEDGQFTLASGVAYIRRNTFTNIYGTAMIALTGAETNVAHPGYVISGNTFSITSPKYGIMTAGAKSITIQSNLFDGGGLILGAAGQQGTDYNRDYLIANNTFTNALVGIIVAGHGANRLTDVLVVSNSASALFYDFAEAGEGAGSWSSNVVFRSNAANKGLWSTWASGQYFSDQTNDFPSYVNADSTATNFVSYARGRLQTVAPASGSSQYALKTSDAIQIPTGATLKLTNSGAASKLWLSSSLTTSIDMPAGYSETFTWSGSAWTTNAISESRRIDWATWTGVPGGVPSRTTVFTNLTGLDATGTTDASTGIIAALAACPSNQAVTVPAGTYLISNQVVIPEGVTLLGSSRTGTVFVPVRGSARADGAFRIGASSDLAPSSMWTNAGTAIKGATNLTLLTTTGLAVGNVVAIEQLNDTNWVYNGSMDGSSPSQDYHGNASATNYAMAQLIEILSISGTNITFSPPLVTTWTNSLNCRLFRRGTSNWPRYAGLENCTIRMPTNTFGTNWQRCLQFGFSVGGYAKDVIIDGWDRYGCYLSSAFRCSVVNCDFIGRNLGGSGGNYALSLAFASGLNRIENNWSSNAISMLVLAEMAHGNALIGNAEEWNYYWNGTSTNTLQAAMSSHDCFTMFNLFEGNVGGAAIFDMSHGNGGWNVIFRNRLYGWQPGITAQNRGVVLDYGHFNGSVVGNVIGGPWVPYYSLKSGPGPDSVVLASNVLMQFGYATGPLPQSFTNSIGHSNVFATALVLGNYIAGATDTTNGIPASQQVASLESSLVYSERPSYFGSMDWPPVKPDSPTTNYHAILIPAMARYAGQSVPTDGGSGARTMNARQISARTLIFR